MSNLVEVQDWVKLSNVKVGSIIDVEDDDRTVVQNLGIDLLLETDGPFPTSFKALMEEIIDWEGSDTEVYVHDEPAQVRFNSYGSVGPTTGSDLKSTIESRFAKTTLQQSLEQDLAARFGAKKAPASGSISANAYVIADKVLTGNPFAQAPVVDPVAKLRSDLASVTSKASATDYQTQALSESIHNVQNDLHDSIHDVNRSVSSVASRLAKLEHQSLQDKINTDLEKQSATGQGGNTTMSTLKNLLGGFTNAFGKVSNQFALSPNGLAVKAEPKNPFSTWIAYDKATGVLTDVQNFIITDDVPAFQLPTVAAQIAEGDIVVNNGEYQYVVEVNDDYISTVCPAKRSRSTVLPVKNMLLNQSFYTVVKTLDLAGQAGFNPMLLMAMGDGDKSKLLPLMLMSGGLGGANGATGAGAIDPMMLALMGDNMDDILPFILMQQGGGAATAGFNPLMLLLLTDKGGKSKDSLLPLLMMGGLGGAQGAQAGAMNPLLMMSLLGDKGGDSGIKDLMMIQALSGAQGGANPFGNLFGAAPAAPATTRGDE